MAKRVPTSLKTLTNPLVSWLVEKFLESDDCVRQDDCESALRAMGYVLLSLPHGARISEIKKSPWKTLTPVVQFTKALTAEEFESRQPTRFVVMRMKGCVELDMPEAATEIR